jgi:hypothetical protein
MMQPNTQLELSENILHQIPFDRSLEHIFKVEDYCYNKNPTRKEILKMYSLVTSKLVSQIQIELSTALEGDNDSPNKFRFFDTFVTPTYFTSSDETISLGIQMRGLIQILNQ